jgi:hypothetical protein
MENMTNDGKAPQKRGGNVPSRDEYLKEIEQAEKEAASGALEDMLDRHVNTIIEIRRTQPLDNTELVTANLSSKNVPELVKKDVENLQEKMRRLIDLAAQRIEERHYEFVEQVLADTDMGYNERHRVQKFVSTDKKFAISCQSVRVCMELFSEFNRRVLEKVNQAVISGDTRTEKNMILGNAVIVYEVADFLSKYIETFRVQGLEDFDQIHREMQAFSKNVRKQIEETRKDAADPSVDEDLRKSIIASAEGQEKLIEAIDDEWRLFMASLDNAKEQVATVSQKLPSIRLIKKNAYNQLSVLQAAEIVNIVKGNINALNAAKVALEKIELAPLPEERIRRLLGIH